ncbi:MAG: hypothetical protein ACKO13_03035 [Cytophagales bacterium]
MRNQFGNIAIFAPMRVIAVKTIKNRIREYPQAKQSVLSWFEEAEKAEWSTPTN